MRKLFSLLCVAFVALFAACQQEGDEPTTSGVTFKFQDAKTTATVFCPQGAYHLVLRVVKQNQHHLQIILLET